MIGVVGLGFVGLTTALGFASKGYQVWGFDVDSEKADLLRSGAVPFHEPHLADELARQLGNNFKLVDGIESLVANCRVIFFCVGTPASASGEADLAFLKRAVENCLEHVERDGKTQFVIKSTVPPTTTANIILPFIEQFGCKVGPDIGLTNNPEFLREGFAWEDFTNPDRIVIGEADERSGSLLEELYGVFSAPVVRVSLTTAEFVKYLSNTLLATLISFANEMAIQADLLKGIDIAKAFNVLHMDRRWFGSPAKMTSYAFPGCGFGGYCLPKDTLAMASAAQTNGGDPRLLRAVLEVNQNVKRHFIQKILSTKSTGTIGILGLTYKPASDDVRDTPAKDLIEGLIAAGRNEIVAYDPMGMENFRKAYNLPIKYAESLSEIVECCDPIAVITAWPDFRDLRMLAANKEIIDGRYFL